MLPTKPHAAAAQTDSHTAAFLDARLNVRTARALFWVSLMLFLLLLAFMPTEVTDNRWFVLSWKAVFNLFVALWMAADARAHNFEEERVKWYTHLSIVLTEFTVPVYLVKSRGWKGAAKASLRFLGYLLLAMVFVVIVGMVAKRWGVHVSF